MDKFKVSIGNIIAIVTVLCSLTGFYYMTQYRLDTLEAEITELKEELEGLHPRRGRANRRLKNRVAP